MDISLPIDHIGVVCHDVVGARNSFDNMGFSVSAIDVLHTGTAQQERGLNCHIYLQNSYVELISDGASHLAEFRAAASGMHILVLATSDISIAVNKMQIAGIKCSDCYHAERPAFGETAKFDWFKIETPLIPHMLVAVVHHLTPELVFPENSISHRNAVSILKQIELFYPDSQMLNNHDVLSKVNECLNDNQPSSRSYPSLCIRSSYRADPMGCCRLIFQGKGTESAISERLSIVY